MECEFNKDDLINVGNYLIEIQFDLLDFLHDIDSMSAIISKNIQALSIDIDPENDQLPEYLLGNLMIFCYKYGEVFEEIGSSIKITPKVDDDE